ncbi:gremlin 1-like protein precursor [Saccoglossus kowalevskii]|uniref:Gremlin 1-like protein n=1 Tax=Saccoglossus kowalevskii TaxID=10224 RepID=D1LX35_SACKO|nr:gremlin 1-like protein precursor [Saccoglossus kowalevskii]ACY92541.1 gremlin 1-like protein [Saccoglossus kowalevskii]
MAMRCPSLISLLLFVFVILLTASATYSKRHRNGHRDARVNNDDDNEGGDVRLLPFGYLPSPDKNDKTHSPDDVLTPSSEEAVAITEGQYLRNDWCKTQPLKQTIYADGCISRTIINRFCYGQCNSFFIPKQELRQHVSAFQSCSFCKPYRFNWITVTLRCPGQKPRLQRKRVQRIKECRCMAVPLP